MKIYAGTPLWVLWEVVYFNLFDFNIHDAKYTLYDIVAMFVCVLALTVPGC
jgi:hypothetical protein